MALPDNPVSGGHCLENPGQVDRWTCPNCHADHHGWRLDQTIVVCSCGAYLALTITHQPVCVATCIDPDADEGA